jgi:hypothetical protein
MRKDSAALHRDARRARAQAQAIGSFLAKLFKREKKAPRYAPRSHLARQG